MPQFTPCLRNKRSDGFWPVYIRMAHNKAIQYISTGLVVNDKGVKTYLSAKGKEKIDICDKFVLKQCLMRIDLFVRRCNSVSVSGMDSKSLMSFLMEEDKELSFSGFAKDYMSAMINEGRERPAHNYDCAIKSLSRFLGSDNVMFKQITSKALNEWIDGMMDAPRKRNMYPSLIKTMIRSAMRKYNDYDNMIVRIKYNPFDRVDIPKNKRAEKRSVPVETIRKFFSSATMSIRVRRVTEEMARDVCLMVFCLAGINVADLYDLKKDQLDGWVLKYKRKKTRGKRDDEAYMEITVPEMIRPLFKKYEGMDRLLSFHDKVGNSGDFVAEVDYRCKDITTRVGMKERITTYVFRHSWATIAQNDCGASTELVAFSLNHASAHKVTEGYIRKSYAPVDKLNEEVIEKVFGG